MVEGASHLESRLLSIHVGEIASFVALVDHGGFTAAAHAMHVSQPAFSARIRRLERALEVTLVDRSVKRLTLTREGRAFQPLARSLLAQLRSALDGAGAPEATA